MTDNLKNVTPLENFDWDAYAKGDVYSKENKEKLTESYDNTLSKINDKEVVRYGNLHEQTRSGCKHWLQIGRCSVDERIPLQP